MHVLCYTSTITTFATVHTSVYINCMYSMYIFNVFNREEIQNTLVQKKVFSFLTKHANITYVLAQPAVPPAV